MRKGINGNFLLGSCFLIIVALVLMIVASEFKESETETREPVYGNGYQTIESGNSTVWICPDCGHEEKVSEQPEVKCCPICGHDMLKDSANMLR